MACELHPETVSKWASDPEVLRLGSAGTGVSMFELVCQSFDPSLYPGRIDEDFGKGCQAAAAKFQQYRLLGEDGVVGPMTKAEMAHAWQTKWKVGSLFLVKPEWPKVYGPWHPSLSWLPDVVLYQEEGGKVSSFGGPDDSGDRIYGQAYIPGAASPAALAKKYPTLMAMGVLRPEIAQIEEYSMTTDWKGREKRADTSWCLNPESYYCAMRWLKSGGSAWSGSDNPRLLVWNERTEKAVVVLRTDWGPHIRTGRVIDLSPGAMGALDLRTDDRVRLTWAENGATLGPVL